MNRRTFVGRLVAASSILPISSEAAASASAPPPRRVPAGGPLLDLLRSPDLVTAFTEDRAIELAGGPGGVWKGGGLEVRTVADATGLAVTLSAPGTSVKRIRLRWRANLSSVRSFLGDHWERSYGDLEWRGEVPNRTMPWYFLAWDGARTSGAGVATAPAGFCFWNADRSGVSLWADVRNGGAGVQLGERTLAVCTVRTHAGRAGETPFAAARDLCRRLCAKPLLPAAPVFGTNDWYYSYGDSHPETLLETTRLVVSLSPGGAVRPWSVVDDGWSPDGREKGMWDRGNGRFGDMQAFARRLEDAGAQPGIWFRPLLAAEARPQALRLSRDGRFLDPTLPDVLAIVAEDTRRLRGWGYRLIKHDYSTFDMLGRWGFDMGPTLTKDGWHFADRSVTTAEAVLRFYRTLRDAAGDALLIGCNTFSHLSAGLFEINRIGDDVSGRAWDRTRRMGVNTLAFRAPHHGTFYAADPDIAPVTTAHPWDKGRQWLQLLAGSGMPLFVSPERRAIGTREATAIRDAFALAARPQPVPEPLDWLETTCPRRWRLGGRTVTFDWAAADGPWPFED
jgi:alpha-galactosidase